MRSGKRSVMGLQGKTAVVTGASKGIGAAIARKLDGAGARVALLARDEVALAAVADGLTNDPVVIRTDLSVAEQVEHAAEAALDALGEVDLLVHNAGITAAEPDGRISAKRLDLLININFRAVVLLTGALSESLLRQRGSIVNVSSLAAWGTDAGQAAYGATKGALNSYTANLARTWAPHGVRVNGVAPGAIETDIWKPLFDQADESEIRAIVTGAIPMGRFGTADEVADVVRFLCSDESSYITGQVIRVDGGR
jgi:NAD(P)-dependent dehydrogenase (short-subunit alcohol dehydrogenase family)